MPPTLKGWPVYAYACLHLRMPDHTRKHMRTCRRTRTHVYVPEVHTHGAAESTFFVRFLLTEARTSALHGWVGA